jgi:transposase-like protein
MASPTPHQVAIGAHWSATLLLPVGANRASNKPKRPETDAGRSSFGGSSRPRPAKWSWPSPKLRKGSLFPSCLEPRWRIDQAHYAVVMVAYVHGVSTRAIDEPVAENGRWPDCRSVGFGRQLSI